MISPLEFHNLPESRVLVIDNSQFDDESKQDDISNNHIVEILDIQQIENKSQMQLKVDDEEDEEDSYEDDDDDAYEDNEVVEEEEDDDDEEEDESQ